MKQRINRAEMLLQFEERLKAGEKSRATIEKYLRDAGQFLEDLGEGSILTKDAVISYKQSLTERYAVASANSKLASVNGLPHRFLHLLFRCLHLLHRLLRLHLHLFLHRKRSRYHFHRTLQTYLQP